MENGHRSSAVVPLLALPARGRVESEQHGATVEHGAGMVFWASLHSGIEFGRSRTGKEVGQERLSPSHFFISLVLGPLNSLLRTFLKVYMELGSYFLFQIKDIIINANRAWCDRGDPGLAEPLSCRSKGTLCQATVDLESSLRSISKGAVPPSL